MEIKINATAGSNQEGDALVVVNPATELLVTAPGVEIKEIISQLVQCLQINSGEIKVALNGVVSPWVIKARVETALVRSLKEGK